MKLDAALIFPTCQQPYCQRFSIQGVEFEGTEECRPCGWMDRVIADGARAFMQENFRGGLRAKILSDGVLSTVEHLGN